MKNQIKTPHLILSLALMIFAPLLWAQEVHYKKGVDYTVMPGIASAKKQVLEFFSYSCPHCYTFDSTIEGYLKSAPSEFSFDRIPVSFGRSDWEHAAKVYTLSELMGLQQTLHHKAFERIHDKVKPFKKESDVFSFFETNGISKEKYEKTAKSFSATSKIRRNEVMTKKYKITSVPTLIVRDIYKIEIGKIKSAKQLEDIVSYLMAL